MTMRATWFYYDPGFSQGWSDTLWMASGSHEDVMAKAQALARRRVALLGTLQRVKYIRVSDDDIRGDSLPFYPGADNDYVQTPKAGQAALFNAADTPWQSINIRMLSSGNARSKFFFFRGVPDRIEINPPGPLVFQDAQYNLDFTGWSNLLVQQGWGWMSRVRVPTVQMGVIVSGSVAAGILTLTSSAAHGLAVGDKVAFRFASTATPKLTGVASVLQVPSATSFAIASSAPTGPLIYTQPPRFYKLTFVFQSIQQLVVADEGKRNVGRPFGQRRGRRKVATKIA